MFSVFKFSLFQQSTSFISHFIEVAIINGESFVEKSYFVATSHLQLAGANVIIWGEIGMSSAWYATGQGSNTSEGNQNNYANRLFFDIRLLEFLWSCRIQK